ncbi:hypothetical protein DXG01_016702 [Tephrocybe rancida]|nr:hypothetical protein DXG01_016702 [Tephrocybe rancida]
MLCYEILVGERPFDKMKPLAVLQKIMKGHIPPRPLHEVALERGLTDTVWQLMEECWSYNPDRRPTAAQILQRLPHVGPGTPSEVPGWTPIQRPGFDTSNGQSEPTIAKALRHLDDLAGLGEHDSEGEMKRTDNIS